MVANGQTVPYGFSTVTPYLTVDDAAAAIDFYCAVFEAEETFRLNGPNNRVVHAEIRIGFSRLMLSETSPNWDFLVSATQLGGSPVHLYLYLDNVDAVFERSLLHGATVIMPVEDQSDGDRRGGVRDPFGLIWWIATALEPEARERLMAEQASDVQ